jgi:hypothetical protein
MITQNYNPSTLEVEFAQAIELLKDQIEHELSGNKIVSIQNKLQADNPIVLLQLEDKDGDKHELVLKIIQRPDADL